ncbi:MAG: DUF1285 domain-containing protein [Hyphomicrobium sp.]|uniref:DUF1285 domain-containing protein n=1 Tax=Hyphomicrobium sp. TaxID=82 RepID=UPI00132BA959|nr:DUF1285 domain-containing protein [Hyphomicrobium sp.]KAB2938132.1 MAG: DUF1285 domain-containing protein [Hyphomicrobium sp.]MBZ0210489.1 DUF1285 domain-containing protein [Hyphomicrobium sp.]
MDDTKARRLGEFGKLEGMLSAVPERRPAPVESWHPPYCGDIGLKIRHDGTWLYQGSPILRPALVKLFAGVLRKDVDGRTYLVTPTEMVDVEVEDAPFLAVEMEARGTGRRQQLVFRTNVDDVVACGHEHPLRFAEQRPGGGLKPYVLVRGRLEALFTRALLHDLVALAVEEPHDHRRVCGVWSGGAFFPIGTAEMPSAP